MRTTFPFKVNGRRVREALRDCSCVGRRDELRHLAQNGEEFAEGKINPKSRHFNLEFILDNGSRLLNPAPRPYMTQFLAKAWYTLDLETGELTLVFIANSDSRDFIVDMDNPPGDTFSPSAKHWLL